MAQRQTLNPMNHGVLAKLQLLGTWLSVKTHDDREGKIFISTDGFSTYITDLTPIVVGGAAPAPAPASAPAPAPVSVAPLRVHVYPNAEYVRPQIRAPTLNTQQEARFGLPSRPPTAPTGSAQAQGPSTQVGGVHGSATTGRLGMPMPTMTVQPPAATPVAAKQQSVQSTTSKGRRIIFRVRFENGNFNVYDGEIQMEQSRFTKLDQKPQQQIKFLCVDKPSKMTFYVDPATNQYFMDFSGDWYSISNI
jgi:hypothetical protein